MKKQLLHLILTLLCCSALLFTLTACDNNETTVTTQSNQVQAPDNGNTVPSENDTSSKDTTSNSNEDGVDPPVHEHTYETKWSKNETHHWHAAVCEHADEKRDYAEHSFGTDNMCTVCSYALNPALIGELEYTLNHDKTGYVVTGIGNVTATNIVIPNTHLDLPVVSIGDNAFSKCAELISVTIPYSVTSIGSNAFSGCTSLTSINIPDGVTHLPGSAFTNCNGIIQEENQVYYVDKWVIDCDISATDVKLRSNTVGIAYNAFNNCTQLKTIVLPDSVKTISNYAFDHCLKLQSITIPPSVVRIGANAFIDCASLNKVYITDITAWLNIEFANYLSYPRCNLYLNGKPIQELVIPNGIAKIGDYAFTHCSQLTTVSIPDSVVSIGMYAFAYCPKLTHISIPNSVTSIDSAAFYDCPALTYTIYDNAKYLGNSQNPYLYLMSANSTSIVSCNIHPKTKVIYSSAFSDCTALTGITIPDSVTTIGAYAFSGCTNLTDITIPGSVTNLDTGSFSGCTDLISITIPNSMTSIGSDAFADCTNLI